MPPATENDLDSLLAPLRAGSPDATDTLTTAWERDRADVRILGHLVFSLAAGGDARGSIQRGSEYLQRNPDDHEMRASVADRFINLGELERAREIYQEIERRDPGNHMAKAGLQIVSHHQRRGLGVRAARSPFQRRDRKLNQRQRSNLEINRRELLADKNRLESMPTHLYLESTTKCNFACLTCSKGYDPYHAEDLERDVLEKACEQLMPTNVDISITGFGEPTLASNFDEILSMAVENGSYVHFVTNASLLSIDRIEQLARSSVSVTVSIDGATPETFEHIRANANFDKIMERMAIVQRMRRIHITERLSHWKFNFVALRSNIHELAEVVRLAKRFDIDEVGVADYAIGQGEFDAESLRNDPAHANRCLEEAKRVAADLGVPLDVPPPYTKHAMPTVGASLWVKIWRSGGIFPRRRRFPQKCANPWNNPYIKTDGTVTPCCASQQVLGSIAATPFVRIWNGWRYRLLRWRIHSVLPPLPCRNCFVCWGINASNPGNVMAQEGLLVKAIYWIEGRSLRTIQAAVRIAHSLIGRRRSAPVPNYHRGRPMKVGGEVGRTGG